MVSTPKNKPRVRWASIQERFVDIVSAVPVRIKIIGIMVLPLLILVFAILAIGPKETIKLFNQGREIFASMQAVLSDLTSEVGNLAKDVVDTSEDKSSTK